MIDLFPKVLNALGQFLEIPQVLLVWSTAVGIMWSVLVSDPRDVWTCTVHGNVELPTALWSFVQNVMQGKATDDGECEAHDVVLPHMHISFKVYIYN